MRPNWRNLPEERTARQLVHAVRGNIEEVRGHFHDIDEPSTNKGALAQEALPALIELAYQTTFSATEKLTDMENEINQLKADVKGAERRAQRADKALSEVRAEIKKKRRTKTTKRQLGSET